MSQRQPILPPLIINGEPKILHEMRRDELEQFLRHVIRCSFSIPLSASSIRFPDYPCPGWWPKELPWSSDFIRYVPLGDDRAHYLRHMITTCYLHHKQRDKLYLFDVHPGEPPRWRLKENDDSTWCLLAINSPTILWTFPNLYQVTPLIALLGKCEGALEKEQYLEDSSPCQRTRMKDPYSSKAVKYLDKISQLESCGKISGGPVVSTSKIESTTPRRRSLLDTFEPLAKKRRLSFAEMAAMKPIVDSKVDILCQGCNQLFLNRFEAMRHQIDCTLRSRAAREKAAFLFDNYGLLPASVLQSPPTTSITRQSTLSDVSDLEKQRRSILKIPFTSELGRVVYQNLSHQSEEGNCVVDMADSIVDASQDDDDQGNSGGKGGAYGQIFPITYRPTRLIRHYHYLKLTKADRLKARQERRKIAKILKESEHLSVYVVKLNDEEIDRQTNKTGIQAADVDGQQLDLIDDYKLSQMPAVVIAQNCNIAERILESPSASPSRTTTIQTMTARKRGNVADTPQQSKLMKTKIAGVINRRSNRASKPKQPSDYQELVSKQSKAAKKKVEHKKLTSEQKKNLPQQQKQQRRLSTTPQTAKRSNKNKESKSKLQQKKTRTSRDLNYQKSKTSNFKTQRIGDHQYVNKGRKRITKLAQPRTNCAQRSSKTKTSKSRTETLYMIDERGKKVKIQLALDDDDDELEACAPEIITLEDDDDAPQVIDMQAPSQSFELGGLAPKQPPTNLVQGDSRSSSSVVAPLQLISGGPYVLLKVANASSMATKTALSAASKSAAFQSQTPASFTALNITSSDVRVVNAAVRPSVTKLQRFNHNAAFIEQPLIGGKRSSPTIIENSSQDSQLNFAGGSCLSTASNMSCQENSVDASAVDCRASLGIKRLTAVGTMPILIRNAAAMSNNNVLYKCSSVKSGQFNSESSRFRFCNALSNDVNGNERTSYARTSPTPTLDNVTPMSAAQQPYKSVGIGCYSAVTGIGLGSSQ